MSSLNTALKIFKKLLDRGQLDRDGDGDLFLEYRNGEVRSILAQMEEEMEFTIVEAGSTLYLVPDSSNAFPPPSPPGSHSGRKGRLLLPSRL
jgi:hypothetical protein